MTPDTIAPVPLSAEEEADWRRQTDEPNDGRWSDHDVKRLLATLDATRARLREALAEALETADAGGEWEDGYRAGLREALEVCDR